MYVLPQRLEPTEIILGAVALYENIWPDYQETITAIEEEEEKVSRFVRATLVNATNPSNYRSNYNMGITTAANEGNETFRKLNNRFYDTLLAATQSYTETMMLDSLHHVEGYNLLRYRGGQSYKAHFDGSTRTRRAVSPILYLNDDYEGGEIEFVHFQTKIKPTAGTLLIFPASYPYAHIAHPVTSGTKYAIVTWLHDHV